MADRARVTGMTTGLPASLAAAVLVLVLPACAADGEGGQAATTTTTTSSEPTSATTDAATSSADAPLTSALESTLNTPEAGEPLTLEDFFNPGPEWEANRYDLAGRSDVQGIATTVSSCSGSYANVLELRLSNKFTTLTFSAAQADNSDSSDQRLTVEILANNEQAEIRAVPFNEIQEFTIPVDSVNALKILLYLDPSSGNCRGSVIGVLHDITVS